MNSNLGPFFILFHISRIQIMKETFPLPAWSRRRK